LIAFPLGEDLSLAVGRSIDTFDPSQKIIDLNNNKPMVKMGFYFPEGEHGFLSHDEQDLSIKGKARNPERRGQYGRIYPA
jgi:hypothetical protein